MGDIKALVHQGNEAFNNRDSATARSLYTDGVRMRGPGMPETTGVDAALMFNQVWWDACSDAHAEITDLAVDGDVALVRGVFTGTHDGVLNTPMGAIPATGTKFRGGFVWMLRYEGARVAEAEIIFDRMLVMEQLGMAPVGAA